MAITNYERVGKSLELLRDGLRPFIERECSSRLGKDRMARRNPDGPVLGQERLATPDGQDRASRQGLGQSRDIPSQLGMAVQAGSAKGYCFCNPHAEPAFPELFRRITSFAASQPMAIADLSQFRNLRANNDNSPQH